jgi:hypothetical protein
VAKCPHDFVALVTFEHDGDQGDHLPLDCQGACGWMAIAADDAEDAAEVLNDSLSAEHLKLVGAEQFHLADSAEHVNSFDSQLAENMRNWEPGRSTVWGTIHAYIGERRS